MINMDITGSGLVSKRGQDVQFNTNTIFSCLAPVDQVLQCDVRFTEYLFSPAGKMALHAYEKGRNA